jgi:hypothetical protein
VQAPQEQLRVVAMLTRARVEELAQPAEFRADAVSIPLEVVCEVLLVLSGPIV